MIKSTRLRYIKASSPDSLIAAVERLPTKIEIKGTPVKDGRSWYLFFTIPDELPKFESVDLTSVD